MAGVRRIIRKDRFGNQDTLVFAKGASGKKLRLSGEDVFSGGGGTRSNDDIFGGEALGGNWNHSQQLKGFLGVRNRCLFMTEEDNGLIYNSAKGNFNTDGELRFEAICKFNSNGTNGYVSIGLATPVNPTTTTPSTSYEATITHKDSDDVDVWKPLCNNGSAEEGTEIVIADNTWFRIKIVITENSAAFYINGTLLDTITGANVPDTRDLQPIVYIYEAGASYIQVKKAKWNFT